LFALAVILIDFASDPDYYPVASNSTGDDLTVITTGQTPTRFSSAANGLNTWGLQASPEATPSYPMSIYHIYKGAFHFYLYACARDARGYYANEVAFLY
jgi:hypothetical protein